MNPVKQHFWTLSATGLDLYGGLSGIGLFLIYLAQFTSEVRHLRLAQEVVATAGSVWRLQALRALENRHC